jgi:3-isopropylmalate dehydrogenase
VRDPSKYDCIVTTNMFGDILSDEASEISGSIGLAGSTMAGDDACCAQAQHGSAPDIAGKDIANPTSLILSAGMLLDWLAARHSRPEFDQAAKAIEAAIDAALQKPETRTRDLGGALGTQDFAKLIAKQIA